MKNRIGDPGDDIDVAYGKAKRKHAQGPRDELDATYAPYSQQLIDELVKQGRSTAGAKLMHNIPLPALDKRTPNKVYEENVDKEAYWSEWYLSKNIRGILMSDQRVGDTIASFNKPALSGATAAITAKLKVLLDGMQYSYATHTPAQVDGTLGKFQNTVPVETGIPSSKLNRKGPLAEKLVGSEAPTYADLVHMLLVGDKWISRGAQGEAHSVVEQFKDKMKSDNDALIWTLLQEADLAPLKTEVEAQYKNSVLHCLLPLDDARLPAAFYTRIRDLQLAARTEVLEQARVEEIITQLET